MLESISSSFVPLRPFIKFHKPIQVRHSQLGALPAGPNVAEDCAGPPNFIIDIYRAAREQFNYMYYTETRSIYLFDVSYKFGTISPVVNGSTHNIQRTSIWQYTRAGTHSVLIYIYIEMPFPFFRPRVACSPLSNRHISVCSLLEKLFTKLPDSGKGTKTNYCNKGWPAIISFSIRVIANEMTFYLYH